MTSFAWKRSVIWRRDEPGSARARVSFPLPPCPRPAAAAVTPGLSTLANGCTSDVGFHKPGCGLDQPHPRGGTHTLGQDMPRECPRSPRRGMPMPAGISSHPSSTGTGGPQIQPCSPPLSPVTPSLGLWANLSPHLLQPTPASCRLPITAFKPLTPSGTGGHQAAGRQRGRSWGWRDPLRGWSPP